MEFSPPTCQAPVYASDEQGYTTLLDVSGPLYVDGKAGHVADQWERLITYLLYSRFAFSLSIIGFFSFMSILLF